MPAHVLGRGDRKGPDRAGLRRRPRPARRPRLAVSRVPPRRRGRRRDDRRWTSRLGGPNRPTSRVHELIKELSTTSGSTWPSRRVDGELAELAAAVWAARRAASSSHWPKRRSGCVALRPLVEGSREMKRLYVRLPLPRHRPRQATALAVIDRPKSRLRTHKDRHPSADGGGVEAVRPARLHEIEPYQLQPVLDGLHGAGVTLRHRMPSRKQRRREKGPAARVRVRLLDEEGHEVDPHEVEPRRRRSPRHRWSYGHQARDRNRDEDQVEGDVAKKGRCREDVGERPSGPAA